MFIKRVKHYHQWLRSSIHLKTKFSQSPPIRSGYKALQKEQALASCIQSLLSKNAIERVENVKSLGLYSRLFLVPRPHQRWRPAIDLSRLNTFLLVERFIRASLIPGEWVSSIDLSDAYLHKPIHPNSRKYLRFCHKSQVFQFTSLLFGLATTSQVFYNDCKTSEADGPDKGNQTSPVPGRLGYQSPVSGRSTSEYSDSGRPDSVLRVDNKSGEIRTKPCSSVFVCGLRIPSRFSTNKKPVKPTQERWLKLQDLTLRHKLKHVLTARYLMSLIGCFPQRRKFSLRDAFT